MLKLESAAYSTLHTDHKTLWLLQLLWSRRVLAKLTISYLRKKFYAFYKTRRFIAFIICRYVYLLWARRIKSTLSPFTTIDHILILSSFYGHVFQVVSCTILCSQILYAALPWICGECCPSYSSWFKQPKNISRGLSLSPLVIPLS